MAFYIGFFRFIIRLKAESNLGILQLWLHPPLFAIWSLPRSPPQLFTKRFRTIIVVFFCVIIVIYFMRCLIKAIEDPKALIR